MNLTNTKVKSYFLHRRTISLKDKFSDQKIFQLPFYLCFSTISDSLFIFWFANSDAFSSAYHSKVDTAKAERKVSLSAATGLGANQMSTAKETHDGIKSQVTQNVMSDEVSIAKAFCGCDSVKQSVTQFDADSASKFNDGASVQNGVYQTISASIPLGLAYRTKNVVEASFASLVASTTLGKVQSAPTVNNGDIVVTTTSMVKDGGRGNVHVTVVRIHQSVK